MKNNKIIHAIIFDLSGTLIDFGSLATLKTMKKVFKSKGIIINNEIIKKDMGIKKKYHIQKILSNPLVKNKWFKKYKKPINNSQLFNLFISFDKELPKIVKKNLNLIPNVKNIFKILKKNNIKIGATTGYPKKITKIILSYLKKNKLDLDYCVSEDEVKKGRPNPDMCIKNLKNLKINNPKKCLKIDDSISGILEGKKAKMLTAGLISTGIQMGLSNNVFKKKDKKKLKNKIYKIKKDFKSVDTDIIIDDLYKLQAILKKDFGIY